MRTKTQIENLRRVFIGMFGPVLFYMPDEQVDAMGDILQEKINKASRSWEIKIKTKDNKECPWEDIEKQPRRPVTSLTLISEKCKDLISKYPDILAIQITNIHDRSETYIFN